jgi:hypothetical protein
LDDATTVELMLGRPPRGRWKVARRCACGLPQVIETERYLDDGTPFPTLWWLTCRSLSRAVGRLEAGGWMAAFNERLAADPVLAEGLRAATEAYVARRDGGCSSGALRGASGGVPGPVRHPGGGGMAGGRIKCLHAHTAHQLVAGDNPAGAEALEELGWEDPVLPCVQPGGR